jgi:hypothetical protein
MPLNPINKSQEELQFFDFETFKLAHDLIDSQLLLREP